MSAEHKPDPEFVEYLKSEINNPFLSAATVMQMERVFIDQRKKYEAARAQQSGEGLEVPEGYVLAPKSMCITQEDVGLIVMMTGWDDEDQDDAEGVLWFGQIEDDDGNRTHGLNISCSECMEEGAIQLVRFDEPRFTHPPKAQGVQDAVLEALQRLIENGQSLGPSSAEDALLVARYRDELFASPTPPADKPEGEWVKCSERLPTEDDADALRQIWIYSDVLGVLPLSKDSFSEPPFYTHWMPTGLTRPAAPDIGGEK